MRTSNYVNRISKYYEPLPFPDYQPLQESAEGGFGFSMFCWGIIVGLGVARLIDVFTK